MALYDELKRTFEGIRDERALHANTATRIGNAFLSLLNYLKDSFTEKFLRKDTDDTAQGIITFLKGLKLGRGNYGIGADGLALLYEVITAGANGVSSDDFIHGDLNIGKGWTLRMIDGHPTLEVDDAFIRRKLTVTVLEVKRNFFTRGSVNLTAANGTIRKVLPAKLNTTTHLFEPFSDSTVQAVWSEAVAGSDGVKTLAFAAVDSGSEMTADQALAYANSHADGFILLLDREDGEKKVFDEWLIGDMALCKEFNVESRTGEDQYTDNIADSPTQGQRVANHQFHRLVVDHGIFIDAGKEYVFVTVSNRHDANGDPLNEPLWIPNERDDIPEGESAEGIQDKRYAEFAIYSNEQTDMSGDGYYITDGEGGSDVEPWSFDRTLQNTVPAVGDDVVAYGNVIDSQRQGVTALSADYSGGALTVQKGIGSVIPSSLDDNYLQFLPTSNPVRISEPDTHFQADFIKLSTGETVEESVRRRWIEITPSAVQVDKNYGLLAATTVKVTAWEAVGSGMPAKAQASGMKVSGSVTKVSGDALNILISGEAPIGDKLTWSDETQAYTMSLNAGDRIQSLYVRWPNGDANHDVVSLQVSRQGADGSKGDKGDKGDIGDPGADGSDGLTPNQNILIGTVFDGGLDLVKEYWNTIGPWEFQWTYLTVDSRPSMMIQGRQGIRINALSLPSPKTFLDFEQDVKARVKPGTWYTLSFYSSQSSLSTWHSYIYEGNGTPVIDREEEFLVDGEPYISSNDGKVEWQPSTSGKRHTVTFRTASSFSDLRYIRILFRAFSGYELSVCMPKLEEGTVATPYLPNALDLAGEDADPVDTLSWWADPAVAIINEDVSYNGSPEPDSPDRHDSTKYSKTVDVSTTNPLVVTVRPNRDDVRIRFVSDTLVLPEGMTATVEDVETEEGEDPDDYREVRLKIKGIDGNNKKTPVKGEIRFDVSMTADDESFSKVMPVVIGYAINRAGYSGVDVIADTVELYAHKQHFTNMGESEIFDANFNVQPDAIASVVSEHLEVGGENLWKNGDFSSGLQRYTRGTIGACTVMENGGDGPSVADFFLRMVPTAQSYNGIYATSDNQPCLPLTSGQTYTLSLFARAQTAGQRLYFGQEYGVVKDDNSSVQLTTSWARYKVTFRVTSDNTSDGQMLIVFQPLSSAYGYVDITGIKLEVGSIATDYSPSTVDLWSMIRQTSRSINMLVNSNVVNLLKDSMFETIGSNGAASSGSPWTTPRANSNNRVYPIDIEKSAFDGFTGIKTKSGYAGERYLYCQAMVREDGDYDENVSLIDPGNRYVLSFRCKGVGRLVVFAYMGSGTTPLAQTPVYVDGVLTSTSSDRNVIANIIMSDTWTRHHVAFAAETSLEDDGTYILGFQGGSGTTEAHICMPMLEKVTSIPRTPSDWTPRTSGLAKIGIDVINGLITLDAAMVQVKNGSQTAAMFSNGKISAALLKITDTLIANAINGKVLNLSQGATLNNVVMNNSSITGILQTKEVSNHTPGTITVKRNPSGSSEVQLANTIRCGVSGANDQIIDFSNLYVGCMDITIINDNGLDPGTGAKTGIKAVSIKVGANQSYTTIYLFKNIPLTIKLIGNTAYIVSGTYTT